MYIFSFTLCEPAGAQRQNSSVTGNKLSTRMNVTNISAKKKKREKKKQQKNEIVFRTDNLLLPARLCVPLRGYACINTATRDWGWKSSDHFWFCGWPQVIEWGREVVWPALHKHKPCNILCMENEMCSRRWSLPADLSSTGSATLLLLLHSYISSPPSVGCWI